MIVNIMKGCFIPKVLFLLLSLSLLFLLPSILSPWGDHFSSSSLPLPFCEANSASDSATSPEAHPSSSSFVPPSLSEPDTVVPIPLKRLAFGSCFMTYHQRRRPLWQKAAVYVQGKQPAAIEEEWAKKYERIENEVWQRISDENPTAWIWLGDAGYSRDHTVQAQREALEQVKDVPAYRSFRQKVQFLDGTWDDHDYGMNDGGKYQANREELQEAYLRFLDIPEDSPRRTERHGVYSSHVFGIPEEEAEEQGERKRDGENEKEKKKMKFKKGTEVKVILLDTRRERDDHLIPSAGTLANISFFAYIAVTTRMLCHLFRWGSSYNGDLLGEEQWKWLEAQLTNSTAAVHVIGSSIQVTTSLPLVESWGHFPMARKRLFDLFERTKPAGLILLSGDVHYSEISGNEMNILEVTSSGMTHSLVDNWLQRTLLRDVLLPLYNGHRRSLQDVYMDRNFGLLDFSFPEDPTEKSRKTDGGKEDREKYKKDPFIQVEAKILDASSGSVKLSASQRFPLSPSHSSSSLREKGEKDVYHETEKQEKKRKKELERKMKEEKERSNSEGDQRTSGTFLLTEQNFEAFSRNVPDVLIAPSSLLEMIFFSFLLPFLLVLWPLYQIFVRVILYSFLSQSCVKRICLLFFTPFLRSREGRAEAEEEEERLRLVGKEEEDSRTKKCTMVTKGGLYTRGVDEQREEEERSQRKNKET
ncbi:phosphodiesterase alkaline phosphatase d family protein [Cystoisospora suis]|uniref:Phosphodiesterase alkaline phosphatase d family protein n=1 Tax=Cystoisospora suis TaxID=483139 RepID=A0A2C6L9S8_9APIC|nr:phosphodiesterase alkaline phosphatase d family protein [Cystoisospora suis]